LTIFDVIPDENAILLMDHHDCLMDEYPLRLIRKPRIIIQLEFREETLLAGEEDPRILTAGKEGILCA
jgi:hypothetical protein